jgi:hypothetical protein
VGRSKSLHSKVHIGVWVRPEVARTLEGLVAATRLSKSEVASRYLEAGLKEKAEHAGTELVVPALEAAIDHAMDRAGMMIADKLSNLLARTALEAGATRQMVLAHLSGQVKSPGDVRAVAEQAWSRSLDSLRKPSEGVRELLRANQSGNQSGNPSDGPNLETELELEKALGRVKLLEAEIAKLKRRADHLALNTRAEVSALETRLKEAVESLTATQLRQSELMKQNAKLEAQVKALELREQAWLAERASLTEKEKKWSIFSR